MFMDKFTFNDLRQGDKLFIVSNKGEVLNAKCYWVDFSGDYIIIDCKDKNYNFSLRLNTKPKHMSSVRNKAFAYVEKDTCYSIGADFTMNKATSKDKCYWGCFLYKKDAMKYADEIVKDKRIYRENHNIFC